MPVSVYNDGKYKSSSEEEIHTYIHAELFVNFAYFRLFTTFFPTSEKKCYQHTVKRLLLYFNMFPH